MQYDKCSYKNYVWSLAMQ